MSFVIDISHHAVLVPVSDTDGVLKPDHSTDPDNMPPTSCWQQIRESLVHILRSKYVAWAIVFVVLYVLLSTRCKYTTCIYC